MTIIELPILHGKVVRSLVEEADGNAGLALECVIPHVMLHARFAPECSQRFDAVGLLGIIPMMPEFLDRMIEPLSDQIRQAAGDGRFGDVLRLAKETRLTCSVLVVVSGREGHGLEALQSIWKGAASEALLGELLGHVGDAYHRIGAAAARGPWKLLALPVVAVAAAAVPLNVARSLLKVLPLGRLPEEGGELLLDSVIGLLPFALTFLFAAWRARRAVRALVGKQASRTPNQGWWARGVGAAAVVALLAGAVVSGNPAVSHLTPGLMQGAPAASRQFVNGPVRMRLLAPSPLPRLKPVFFVEKTRGASDVFWLQFHLKQLGFLHVLPDGIIHPSTYDALAMFNDTLPPTRTRVKLGWDAAATAASALRGEFVLQRRPIDRFPLPPLSNMARANLTGMDTEFMKRAARQALASPGQEIRWRSTDGTHGGRLLATLMPIGCPLLQVEVEIRGEVEGVGPFPFCQDRQR